MFRHFLRSMALGCIRCRRAARTIPVLLLGLLQAAGNVAVAEIPVGHFTDIVPVLADPSYLDFNPTVTADGLTMIFTNAAGYGLSRRPDSFGSFDLYKATRTNTEEPFGNIVNLGSPVNTDRSEESSSISPDGQALYFGSTRDGGLGQYDLFQATLDGGAFGNVLSLGSGVNSTRNENRPSVSADGKTIYYNEQETSQGGKNRIWSADRLSTDLPFGNAQDLGDDMNGLPDVGSRGQPSISSDERFMFYYTGTLGTSTDIFVSTRPTTGDQFGSPMNINDLWPGTEINTDGYEGRMHISRDWPAAGSKIYFTNVSSQLGFSDIFQATWVPEPAAGVLLLVGIAVTVSSVRRRQRW